MGIIARIIFVSLIVTFIWYWVSQKSSNKIFWLIVTQSLLLVGIIVYLAFDRSGNSIFS